MIGRGLYRRVARFYRWLTGAPSKWQKYKMRKMARRPDWYEVYKRKKKFEMRRRRLNRIYARMRAEREAVDAARNAARAAHQAN